MKNSIKFTLRMLSLVVATIFLSSVNAKDVTSEKKATLKLKMPYTELLWGEIPHYSVTLINKKIPKLRYFTVGSEPSFMEEYCRLQLFFESKHSYPIPSQELCGPEKIYKIEKDGDWNNIITHKEDTKILKPNESVSWKSFDLAKELTTVCYNSANSLQAKFLIGPKKWISSNVIKIKRVKPDKKPIAIFEYDYVRFENNQKGEFFTKLLFLVKIIFFIEKRLGYAKFLKNINARFLLIKISIP